MKSIALVLATVALVAACGTQNQSNVAAADAPAPKHAANMFSCEVEGGYQFNYTTTSFSGKPHLNISQTAGEANLSVISVIGAESITVKKVKGVKTVSVSKYIPDFATFDYSLALKVTEINGWEGQSFETTLVEVKHPTSIIGPLPGQKPVTTIRKASCQAQFANF